MRLLLDTHALLWWLKDDPRLGARVHGLIADPANAIVVSAVSGWEMSIKRSLGRLKIDLDILTQEVIRSGFTILEVNMQHGILAGALPMHHRDPFDRMLIAQAQCESLHLVSIDEQFAAYDVALLWK